MGTYFDRIGTTISDTASDIGESFGYETDRYEAARDKAEAEFYSRSTDDYDYWDEDTFREEYYKGSTKKVIDKAAKAVGKYKETPQEKSAIYKSKAPRKEGSRVSARGFSDKDYGQERRGMTSGELEKLLLDSMQANARMSVFTGGFGRRGLL